MTAAYRLKGLGWFGGVVFVSLGFYLVSLQVAAERKKLAQIEARIGAAERDIRALETEFDVRANLVQLERWNGDTLALVAPTAQQFVRDEGQLAAISFANGVAQGAAAGDAEVRTAALIVPSRPSEPVPAVIDEAPAAAPATLVRVAARRAEPRAATVAATVHATAPVTEAARPMAVRTATVAAGATVATIRKARAVAMLDKSLLSDSTLGDLMSGARSETSRLR